MDGPFPSFLKFKQHALFLDWRGSSPAALYVSAEQHSDGEMAPAIYLGMTATVSTRENGNP